FIGQLSRSPAAALSAALCLRKERGPTTTLPTTHRCGVSHSIKFGCIFTYRFRAVFVDRTVISASSKSTSLHCSLRISDGRRPPNKPIAQYGNISRDDAASSRRASSTLNTSTSLRGSFASVSFTATGFSMQYFRPQQNENNVRRLVLNELRVTAPT